MSELVPTRRTTPVTALHRQKKIDVPRRDGEYRVRSRRQSWAQQKWERKNLDPPHPAPPQPTRAVTFRCNPSWWGVRPEKPASEPGLTKIRQAESRPTPLHLTPPHLTVPHLEVSRLDGEYKQMSQRQSLAHMLGSR